MSEYTQKIAAAVAFLSERMPQAPRLGLVLGSGWGGIVSGVEDPICIPYDQVPGMCASTVAGHAGQWIFGTVNGRYVAIMSGRLHYYEGHDLKDVTAPIRIMKEMGVQTVVLTNAAGAVNTSFKPGDLMLITDHISMTGVNPLFGKNEDQWGPRFPDMSKAYDPELLSIAEAVAQEQNFPIQKGVYTWMSGPSFETPAEIRMVRSIGGDAVGMSTVPEAIVARHGGMRVLAASCMTNMAAGVLDQPLCHEEVLETAERVKDSFRKYLYALVGRV